MPHMTLVRFAQLSSLPPAILFSKVFNQNSVPGVEFSELRMYVMCCLLLRLEIHDLLFNDWTKKKVSPVRSSGPRNGLAGVHRGMSS